MTTAGEDDGGALLRSPQAWGAGAAGYDAEFARFTGLYADELLDALGVGAGTRFLDVAAGTGALTLPAVARGARVTATDWSPGMVEVLRGRLAAAGARADVAVMDAADLDLDDGTQDAVGSMFGLMFVPDVADGVAEARRVTVAGGSVGTLTWDLTAFPMHRMVGLALDRVLPPRPDPPPPEWASVGAADGLRDALVRGGLVDVDVRPVVRRWRFEDPAAFFRSMPEWSPPVRPLLAALSPEQLATAAEGFAEVVVAFAGGGDGVPAGALLGTGRVP